MQDLKEQIKELFLKHFQPQGQIPVHMSTSAIHDMLRGVIPSQPITEYDIYDAMKEMGFTEDLEILYSKEQIFEGDDDDGTTDEFDKKEIGKIFLWRLFKV
jgi:hypothetical protein